jgi:methionyl aminopeptidase
MPQVEELSPEQISAMRESNALAAKVLALAGAAVKPGVTTLELDDLAHEAIVAAGAYPSPLNYRGFTRSTCTSVNEIVCHGIPDDRPLEDGDLISIDVSVYLNGVHGDTCRTFFCGKADEQSELLVQATKDALQAGIDVCGPGVPVSAIGDAIGAVAAHHGLGTVEEFVGHGIGSTFHTRPQVFHFSDSQSKELLAKDTCFTIEPMLTLGKPKVTLWRDGWTVATSDRSRSAQFEHTLLVTDTGVETLTTYPDEPRA